MVKTSTTSTLKSRDLFWYVGALHPHVENQHPSIMLLWSQGWRTFLSRPDSNWSHVGLCRSPQVLCWEQSRRIQWDSGWTKEVAVLQGHFTDETGGGLALPWGYSLPTSAVEQLHDRLVMNCSWYSKWKRQVRIFKIYVFKVPIQMILELHRGV